VVCVWSSASMRVTPPLFAHRIEKSCQVPICLTVHVRTGTNFSDFRVYQDLWRFLAVTSGLPTTRELA
jgi:hypothetical protein